MWTVWRESSDEIYRAFVLDRHDWRTGSIRSVLLAVGRPLYESR